MSDGLFSFIFRRRGQPREERLPAAADQGLMELQIARQVGPLLTQRFEWHIQNTSGLRWLRTRGTASAGTTITIAAEDPQLAVKAIASLPLVRDIRPSKGSAGRPAWLVTLGEQPATAEIAPTVEVPSTSAPELTTPLATVSEAPTTAPIPAIAPPEAVEQPSSLEVAASSPDSLAYVPPSMEPKVQSTPTESISSIAEPSMTPSSVASDLSTASNEALSTEEPTTIPQQPPVEALPEVSAEGWETVLQQIEAREQAARESPQPAEPTVVLEVSPINSLADLIVFQGMLVNQVTDLGRIANVVTNDDLSTATFYLPDIPSQQLIAQLRSLLPRAEIKAAAPMQVKVSLPDNWR